MGPNVTAADALAQHIRRCDYKYSQCAFIAIARMGAAMGNVSTGAYRPRRSRARCVARTVLAVCAALGLWACGGGGDGGTAGAALPAANLAITAPADLASGLADSVTLSARANTAAASIEIQLDGQAVGAAGSGTAHSVSIDSSTYASGQHIVRARTVDAAGNPSAWVSATLSFGGSRTQPAGVTRNEAWLGGLDRATAFAQTPDARLLVAEQGGTLRVVKNGVLLAAPMLSLAPVDSNGERGLIGVAVHPNFAVNGYVYVYHTTTANGSHNRITRFTASGDQAGGASVIADLPALSAATNHNGGALHFGSDGKLYVGVGDNADGNRAPDPASVFGKLLRFNDDGSIPSDNPFCSTPATQACAVWARGLRNPFTFAIQPVSGRHFINDVGEGS